MIDDLERFYTRTRRHSSLGYVSPHDFERVAKVAYLRVRFYLTTTTRFYPCESVVAVSQVKSSLRTRDEFRSAMANLASVKALDRSAGGKAVDNTFGETLDPLENHLH